MINIEEVEVNFRKWKNDNEVIALFPDISEGRGMCLSYMHNGQHVACNIDIENETVPATQNEYKYLKKELESIGYNLKVNP